MIKDELIHLLNKYNIKFQTWGAGTAKSLDHLLKEIQLGEAVLQERDGKLFRLVKVIVFNVFFLKENKKYKLYEDKQVYKDGRVVNRDLKDSLWKN